MIKKISAVLLLLVCLLPLGVFASEVDSSAVIPPIVSESVEVIPETTVDKPSAFIGVTPSEERLDAYIDTMIETKDLVSILVTVCCVVFGAVLALGFCLCLFH